MIEKSHLWGAQLLIGLLAIVVPISAQQKAEFAGDYAGLLGPLHVKLHLKVGPDGALTGSVDSTDQSLTGLPCANVVVNGQSLSFTVPSVRGTWAGVLSSDRNSLSGVWTQGASPMPLNLVRVDGSGRQMAAAPTAPPRPMAGTAAATSASAESPCTGIDILGAAYYWDGSIWRKMSPPALLKLRQGYSLKGGLMTLGMGNGGNTTVFRYEGTRAPITLGSRPKFVMCAPASSATANFVIARVDVKKNYRQIESLSRIQTRGNFIWVPKKRREPISVRRISETVFEIKPAEPLLSGQYLLVAPSLIAGGFDFGVQ